MKAIKRAQLEETVMFLLFLVFFVFCFIVFDSSFLRAIAFIIVSMIASEQLTDWLHGK